MAAVTQVRILVTAVTFFLSLLSNLSDTNLGALATFQENFSEIMMLRVAFQAVDPVSIPG